MIPESLDKNAFNCLLLSMKRSTSLMLSSSFLTVSSSTASLNLRKTLQASEALRCKKKINNTLIPEK
jgi:hypothetical protein